MSKVDINSDQWCDLVFENRNTEFGAFVLRKDSSRRHFKAMLIAIIIFLLAVTAPILVKKVLAATKKTDDTARSFDYIDPDKTKKPDDEVKDIPETPKEVVQNVVQFVPPVITPDKDVAPDEEPPITSVIAEDTHKISTVTVTNGTDKPDAPMPTTEQHTIIGTPPEDKVVEVAEQMPEYPGGIQALYEYISETIVYPASASEAGIQGKVVVSFVVGKDGRLTDIKLQKTPGRDGDPALEEEALRVVKTIKPWSPGKQGNAPVRVKMSIPIFFKINN